LPAVKKPVQTFDDKTSKNILSLLDNMPHGVIRMWDKTIPKTSCNLAIIRTEKNHISITSSCRSFSQKENEKSVAQVKALFEKYAFKARLLSGYVAWEPEPRNSVLVKSAVDTYKKLFHKTPKALPMHAGLECGVIKAKYPGLQAISMGPNIKNPHSPDERIEIKSIENTWIFLKELLNQRGSK